MSLILRLADAVTAELNAAPATTFGSDLSVVAVRRVLPVFDLAQLTTLQVSVVPKAIVQAIATRATAQMDLSIDIGLQQKLTASAATVDIEVAALCRLVEAIARYLQRRPLSALPGVQWVRTANEPIYAADHLAQQRVFTSVLTVTYRGLV
jgi:hypothetical protein